MSSFLKKFSWSKVKSKIHRMRYGFDSAGYWEGRYAFGGNSGAGSYSRLAEFKAEIVNNFVSSKEINSCIEWGFGDGNQLALFSIPVFHGVDVSKTVVQTAKERFSADLAKTFESVSAYKKSPHSFDLSMSLDVIYHLIEDAVFEAYMRDLFDSSRQYVVIYASNKQDENYVPGFHVKHRKFTEWIDKNRSQFKQIEIIPNRYPFDANDQEETSFADFYIYEKT
jgi:hypothetical protein